jgi:hypothetical protein
MDPHDYGLPGTYYLLRPGATRVLKACLYNTAPIRMLIKCIFYYLTHTPIYYLTHTPKKIEKNSWAYRKECRSWTYRKECPSWAYKYKRRSKRMSL